MRSKNLGKCFDASASPDKIALIEPRDFENPRETTYAELDAECDAVARGLVARGYRPGDRIGILSLNSRELLAAYRDHEDLISIGAYRRGANRAVDLAIEMLEPMQTFLKQKIDERSSVADAVAALRELHQKCVQKAASSAKPS